jgi:hypothetical protein
MTISNKVVMQSDKVELGTVIDDLPYMLHSSMNK